MHESIDHGLLSPSGRMSKRARKAALDREAKRLWPNGCTREDIMGKGPPPPTNAEKAAQLRQMAGPRQAKKLLAEAEELERC